MLFKRFHWTLFLVVGILVSMLGFATAFAQDEDDDGVPDEFDVCPFDVDMGLGFDADGCAIFPEDEFFDDEFPEDEFSDDEFPEDDVFDMDDTEDPMVEGDLIAQAVCTPEGIVAVVTNVGEIDDSWVLTIDTESGVVESDTIELGVGESDETPPIPESFLLFLGDEILLDADIDDCDEDATAEGDGELVYDAVCTADGIVASLSNNSDEPVAVDVEIVTESGEVLADAVELAPGEDDSTPPFDESFEVFSDGEFVLDADIDDCDEDATAEGDGELVYDAVCTADGIVASLSNNSDEPIAVDVEIVTESGEVLADTVELAPGEDDSTPPFDESFFVIVDDEIILDADIDDCEDDGEADDADFDASARCEPEGVVAVLFNDGDETGALQVTLETESGISVSDDVELAPGESLETDPVDESFVLLGEGEVLLDVDISDCELPEEAEETVEGEIDVADQCTPEGVEVTFTNNGDEPIPANTFEVELEAVADDSNLVGLLPALNPGDQVGLITTEDVRVFVNGDLLGETDISACGDVITVTQPAPPPPHPPADPPPQAGSGGGNDTTAPGGAADFLALINAERARNGAGPVSYNPQLTTAARLHSEDMVSRNYFEHDAPAPAPNGVDIGSRVRAAGYTWSTVGENIAQGDQNEAAVFQSWMNSDGHRRNMLNPAFTEIGLARVGNTWTLVLAAPL